MSPKAGSLQTGDSGLNGRPGGERGDIVESFPFHALYERFGVDRQDVVLTGRKGLLQLNLAANGLKDCFDPSPGRRRIAGIDTLENHRG